MEKSLKKIISDYIDDIKIIDIFTNLFPISFDNYCLFGIDNLLTENILLIKFLVFIAKILMKIF